MQNQKLKFYIPNVSTKLEKFFPNDPHGDLKISYNREKIFKLQKSYLRFESKFFSDCIDQNKTVIQINQKFKPYDFEKVMSCFYGARLELKPQQIYSIYPICKFLKAQSLLKLVQDYIKANFHLYDLWSMTRISFQIQQTQIFRKCFEEFQKNDYKVLKDRSEDLLEFNQELFKYLIKNHNKLKTKQKTALTYLDIDEIIKLYSTKFKDYEEKYTQLKRELIDKNSLTSNEYKVIFHDQLMNPSNTFTHFNKSNNSNFYRRDQSSESKEMIPNKTLSYLPPMNSEYIVSENTYFKKRMGEISSENSSMIKQIEEIKARIENENRAKLEFEKILEEIREREEKQNKILNTLDNRLIKLEEQLRQKDRIIKYQKEMIMQLNSDVEKIKVGGVIPQHDTQHDTQEAEQSILTVKSKIISAEKLEAIMKPLTKEEKPVRLKKQKNLNESFLNRIEFSNSPLSFSIDLYPKLIQILEIDTFAKVQLNLLFRSSEQSLKNNDKATFFNKVINHSNLIIFMKSNFNKVFGAYISIALTDEDSYAQSSYLDDQNAYIFQLNYGKKYKSKSSQAIYLSDQYLIAFGEDLMIHKKWLQKQSSCNWPNIFAGQKSIDMSSKWFTGSHKFKLQEMQVYEIMQEQMQMKI